MTICHIAARESHRQTRILGVDAARCCRTPLVVELETTGCLLARWAFGMMRLGILMAKCANGEMLARGCVDGVISHVWFVRYKTRVNERRKPDAKIEGKL
jgi:hypothetical protein